jgi:uncharacterized protein YukE
MATVRELITIFGFKPDEESLDRIEGIIGGLKNGLLAVAAGAAAGAASIYGIASSVAAFGDTTIKTAQRIGLTAESLQQLDFALNISGTSMQEQRASFVRLARSANEAAQGVETYTDIYDRLGVNVRDANGDMRSTEDLILALSDSFAGMPDGIEKTATAQELFGRSGTRMLQFLNLGSDGIRELMDEASALGGVMSTEAAKKAEVFNDTVHRLRTAVGGLKTALGVELIPAVTEIVQSVLDWTVANRELLNQNLKTAFLAVADAVRLFGRVVLRLLGAMDWLIQRAGGLRQVVDGLAFSLAVLAVRAILFSLVPALAAWVTGLATAVSALTLATIKTWALNAAVAAMPLAISAFIVLIGIAADDFARFVDGQDSLIGRLVNRYGDAADEMGGFFAWSMDRLRDVGEYGSTAMTMMADDTVFAVERIQAWFRRMGLRVQLMLGEISEAARELMDELSLIPGIDLARSEQERSADLYTNQRIRDEIAAEEAQIQRAIEGRSERRYAIAEAEMSRRRGERVDASGRPINAPTTVNATVNVNGGDPEQVQRAVSDGIAEATAQRQRELLRSLGLPSNLPGAV